MIAEVTNRKGRQFRERASMRTNRLRSAASIGAVLIGLLMAASLRADDAPTTADVDLQKIFAGAAPKNTNELRAMQNHLRELSEKLIRCTVGVRVGQAQGSAVIISKDGYVLCAGHVCGKPDQDVVFIFHDGKKAHGKTLGMNVKIDSGLMKITTEGEWPFLEMGNSADLKNGQWVVATGHPGGYQRGREPVVRLGRVLMNGDKVIITDCALVGGDSGGPLFDMDGKVVGINSRIGGPVTQNMHVPVKTYQDTWDRLAKGDLWGYRPFIGVMAEPESEVAKILEVYPGTPADKAGIKKGDIILRFADKDVANFKALQSIVGKTNPGDKVKVQVRRGDETVDLELKVGRRPG